MTFLDWCVSFGTEQAWLRRDSRPSSAWLSQQSTAGRMGEQSHLHWRSGGLRTCYSVWVTKATTS